MALRLLVPSPISPIICSVFLMAVGAMYVIAALEYTLLLYLNHVGFASSTDSSFYVFTFAMYLLIPVIGNVALGLTNNRIGSFRTLSLGYVTVIAGLLVLILFRSTKYMFLLGFALASLVASFRSVRISLLSDIVNSRYRTSVLAFHHLMAPVGALLGPMAWYVIQLWQGQLNMLPYGFVVDRFSANYGMCVLVMLGKTALALRMAKGNSSTQVTDVDVASNTPCGHLLRTQDCKRYNTFDRSMSAAVNSCQTSNPVVPIYFQNGSMLYVKLNSYLRNRLLFCGLVLLGVMISTGVYRVAVQLLLVNVFGASDGDVAKMFLVIAGLAVIPPIAIAIFSGIVNDRTMMVIGLVLKLIGILLHLPVFGAPVRRWQVVAGFTFVIKASMFFVTAILSVFTKIVGKLRSSSHLGYLMALANFGTALAQIVLSSSILNGFGGWYFGVYGIPALLSSILIFSPSGWRLLNPENEYTKLVLTAMERQT